VQSAQALQEAFSNGSNIRVEELVSPTAAVTTTGNVPRSALAGVLGALVS
jgi:hypothetical protein